jgi:hypothetical protein
MPPATAGPQMRWEAHGHAEAALAAVLAGRKPHSAGRRALLLAARLFSRSRPILGLFSCFLFRTFVLVR